MASGVREKTRAAIEKEMEMFSGPAEAEVDEPEPEPEPEPAACEQGAYGAPNIDMIETSIYRNREKNRDERLVFKTVPKTSNFDLSRERKLLRDFGRVEYPKYEENVDVYVPSVPQVAAIPTVPSLSDFTMFPPLLPKIRNRKM